MKKLLVTGAAGFVGANLIRYFFRNFEIHGIVRSVSKISRLEEIKDNITLHEVDIADAKKLNQCVKEIQPEYIIHCATYGVYPEQNDLQKTLNTNFQGAINLLQACKQFPFISLINIGSDFEYGKKDYPKKEDDVPEPESNYAIVKTAATLYFQGVAKKEGLPITTLRLFCVYGPFEPPGRLFPDLCAAYEQGNSPKLSSPDNVRDFVYIQDVCIACDLVFKNSQKTAGQILNVCTGVEHTVKQVVEAFRACYKNSPEPTYGSAKARTFEPIVAKGDTTKIQRILGWKPATNLQQGVQETLAWYKKQNS